MIEKIVADTTYVVMDKTEYLQHITQYFNVGVVVCGAAIALTLLVVGAIQHNNKIREEYTKSLDDKQYRKYIENRKKLL